jgi:hypothetical protein
MDPKSNIQKKGANGAVSGPKGLESGEKPNPGVRESGAHPSPYLSKSTSSSTRTLHFIHCGFSFYFLCLGTQCGIDRR